jgi:hypothetical protein
MLACFVHKDNQDLATQPAMLKPSSTRKESKIEKAAALTANRDIDKAKHPPPSQ